MASVRACTVAELVMTVEEIIISLAHVFMAATDAER